MLHKATQRKLPKKYQKQENQEMQQLKKASTKTITMPPIQPQKRSNQRQASVKGKVNQVENKVDKVLKGMNNAALQNLLIEEIKGIKNDLKEIKYQMGLKVNNQRRPPLRQQEERYEEPEQEEPEEENIYNIKPKVKEMSNFPVTQKQSSVIHNEYNEPPPPQVQESNYTLSTKQKQLMDVRKIQPYMKEFKIQMSEVKKPFYHGYHKKSSKPVIIKYCSQSKSMEPIFNLYEKLWKNIVKSKYICLNKVYDLNEPLATYILVIEANKHSLADMLASKVATVPQILISLVKAVQFFHQCGYLYRNFHPLHVMGSYENEVVLIDLKCMMRFVDIKGKHMSVVRDAEEINDQFISNNRARGLKQGRKDDLESLGYLGLFMLQGQLPWNIHNLVQVRSKLTLKELCGKYLGLMQFMINVAQMATEDVPNYEKLIDCLSKL